MLRYTTDKAGYIKALKEASAAKLTLEKFAKEVIGVEPTKDNMTIVRNDYNSCIGKLETQVLKAATVKGTEAGLNTDELVEYIKAQQDKATSAYSLVMARGRRSEELPFEFELD